MWGTFGGDMTLERGLTFRRRLFARNQNKCRNPQDIYSDESIRPSPFADEGRKDFSGQHLALNIFLVWESKDDIMRCDVHSKNSMNFLLCCCTCH